MAFRAIVGSADAARGYQSDLIPDPFGHEELVHLGNGVSMGMGDISSCDVRRRSGAP